MATTIAATPVPPRKPRSFSPRRPSDYNFFLIYVLLIWAAVLAGFGPDMVRHIRSNSAPYPLIVHIHAGITLGWLGLLTSQIRLIRQRKIRLHRKWGIVGGLLAIAVVIVGFWTALSVESLALHTPKSRPQFLAIEWSNIIEFASLASSAVLARNRPSAHKRFILLATVSLTPAAFNRAIGVPYLHPLLGSGVWETFVQIFAATDLMVLGIGIYDFITRQRLHPAWLLGAMWILTGQITASWLFYDAAWKVLATSIVQSW